MRSNAVTPCISQRVSATWRVACNNCVAQDHPRRCGLAAGAVGSASSDAASGKCYLVGAGPGPIDLLTLRAVRTLEKADVIVYDDLGAQEALAYAPAAAERVYVGKRGGRPSIKQPEIDQLLVDKCRQGLRVVRLKGGCPSVFSRVNSEILALSAAGCDFEMVPGVSSALAAPVLAGFPLTDAQLSRSFAVTTGHDADSAEWEKLAGVDTLVILMGGRNLPVIVQRLTQLGRPAGTPASVIKAAGTREQRVWRSRLGGIVEATAGCELSPCIIVVGAVAAGLQAAAAAAGADAAGYASVAED